MNDENIISILIDLENRKKWAESASLMYFENESIRTEYDARVEEIQNCISLIELHIKK